MNYSKKELRKMSKETAKKLIEKQTIHKVDIMTMSYKTTDEFYQIIDDFHNDKKLTNEEIEFTNKSLQRCINRRVFMKAYFKTIGKPFKPFLIFLIILLFLIFIIR